VPEAFSESVADPVGDLLSRFARTHGPFSTRDVADHLGLGTGVVEALLQQRKSTGRLRWGRFSATGQDGEWIDPDVLQRIRRRASAILRGAQEPIPAARLCGFLPRWQSLTAPARGPGALLTAVERLAGYVAAASVWENDLLSARIVGFAPHELDRLTAAGDVTWTGAGRLGSRDALITMVPAGAEDLLPLPDDADLDDDSAALWELMSPGGGWFFRDLSARLDVGEDVLEAALWDLLWRSMITNDTLEPLRRMRTPGARSRRERTPRTPMPGRWSAIRRPMAPDRGLLWAQTLLNRYGLVDRSVVGNERVPGGFHGLFPVLRRMDDAGRCQQVYALEGLGGAQFAFPSALERLRHDRGLDDLVMMAATDPANPLGVTVAWPESPGRPLRKAGSLVWLTADGPAFYLDAAGRTLLAWGEPSDDLARRLSEGIASGGRRVVIRRINGEEVFSSEWSRPLQDAGFVLTPSGLRAGRR
jgi:ATP-dependent Lhr-like helicase